MATPRKVLGSGSPRSSTGTRRNSIEMADTTDSPRATSTAMSPGRRRPRALPRNPPRRVPRTVRPVVAEAAAAPVGDPAAPEAREARVEPGPVELATAWVRRVAGGCGGGGGGGGPRGVVGGGL